MRIRNNSRAAFTLIEILVAAALAMFLMVIITGAFQAGLETWRQLKGVGEQMEKLRSVANMIHRDLAMPHFGRDRGQKWEGPFLKDQWLDHPSWTPPEEGFFRILQGSAVQPAATVTARYRQDGTDGDGIPAFIATDHVLHFSINTLGRTHDRNVSLNRYGELFSTRLSGPDVNSLNAFLRQSRPDAFIEKADTTSSPTGEGNFVSPWAEVAYYLVDTNQVITDEKLPTPTSNVRLYTLRRRQRLAVMGLPSGGFPVTPATVAAPPNMVPPAKPYQEVSFVSGSGWVNRPEDLPVPERRWGGKLGGTGTTFTSNPLGAAPETEKLGDDIIMTDVISFEVKASWKETNPASTPMPINPCHTTPAAATAGIDFPFSDLPVGDNTVLNATGARVFDTWTDKDDPLASPGPAGPYATSWNPGNAMGDQAYRIPLKIRITALQIHIRIWDAKLQQARQITIVQDT